MLLLLGTGICLKMKSVVFAGFNLTVPVPRANFRVTTVRCVSRAKFPRDANQCLIASSS